LGNDFADLYSQKETITYTVRMPYVNADLSVGDTVYHWNKDSSRGTVTDIRVEEKTTETDSCVYVTVTVDARKIKTSYYINGKKIEEGTTIDISFSRFDPSNSAECIMVKAS
ncbi:MAG: hypothetical protein IKA02_02415, partial [Clostridia bacterium]|nr:hypothetical protein [Clostridia bacterium]